MQLLIAACVWDVHELRHGEANGGYDIFHVLNKTHTVAHFNNKHVNACFTVYFSRYNTLVCNARDD